MVLGLLAVASLVTVVQRMLVVRRQALASWRVLPAVRSATRLDRQPGSALGWAARARCPSAPHTRSSTGSPTSPWPAAVRARLRANYARVRPDLDDAGLDALVA